MKRRNFLKTAGGTAILTPLWRVAQNNPVTPVKTGYNVGSKRQPSSIQVNGKDLIIETATLKAKMSDGFLTSLVSKSTGEEYITGFDREKNSALQLVFPNAKTFQFNTERFTKTSLRQLNDQYAEIIFHSWDGDGIITVKTDDKNGDLILEPSAYTAHPEVLACRWNLPGIRKDLQLVAPFFQGIKLKLDDPLITGSRWKWPYYWEAGLAILQSKTGGFYIHTRDTRYIYKALQVGTKEDPFVVGLDTEAYGPIEHNLSAGGLAWRINVYQGDWQVPAGLYRDWLWDAYDLKKQEEERKPWIGDVKLAVSWCPDDPAFLKALAKKIAPSKVLLHYPDWRSDPYDENYPTYNAGPKGKEFIQQCHQMGFHVMPHFNSIDMDPSNPVYNLIRDFQYRDVETRNLMGWSWVNDRGIGVPESNETRMEYRHNNVMIKVHPGLAMWRSILGEHVQKAATDLDLKSVFLDVTLVTQNLDNCLVESQTSTEGMNRLINHIRMLNNGLVVGGEGLNEITMQGLSFAQAHLFKSWQTSIEGLERTGGCNLNQVLFGKLARIIGYSGLSGKTKDEEMRMRIHVEHGGIPTITVESASEIENPNPAVKNMLDLANNN